MKRDLQDKFFQIFEIGGVWHIARSLKSYHDGKILVEEKYSDRWGKQFKADESRMEQFIDDFDDGMLISPQMPLMREIEDCLNGLNSKDAQERYISSIIVRLSDIGNILYPNTSNVCSEQIAKDALNQASEYLEIYGNPEGSARIEIEAISWCIFMLNQFVNRLDALCLSYHIDIEKLQDDAGIRLRSRRLIGNIMGYVGSYELTVKYLKDVGALPDDILQKKESEQSVVPPVASTDKNQKITTEQLKSYFMLKYYNQNYDIIYEGDKAINISKFDRLVKDIESFSSTWNSKITAALARLIYRNCLLDDVKKATPFKSWLLLFQSYCGKKFVYYKESTLDGYGEFLKPFEYLVQ